MQSLVNRFQKFENVEMDITKKTCNLRGSIALDPWHSQTMNNTDLCPLSLTSLSPSIDHPLLKSNYQSAATSNSKHTFFPLKQE